MNMLKILAFCSVMLFVAVNGYALQVGDRAPDFTAESTAGEVSLSGLLEQGPLVLSFYFADFTSV